MLVYDFLISNFPYFLIYIGILAILTPLSDNLFKDIKVPSFITLPFYLSFIFAMLCFFLGIILGMISAFLPEIEVVAYNSGNETRIIQMDNTEYSVKPKTYRTISYPSRTASVKGKNDDGTQILFQTQLSEQGNYVANLGSEEILDIEELYYKAVLSGRSSYEHFGIQYLTNGIILVDKSRACTYHYDTAPSEHRSSYSSRHFLLKTR